MQLWNNFISRFDPLNSYNFCCFCPCAHCHPIILTLPYTVIILNPWQLQNWSPTINQLHSLQLFLYHIYHLFTSCKIISNDNNKIIIIIIIIIIMDYSD